MTFKRAIPGWVVGLVIIVTATVTLAAVVKTQTALSWTPEGVPESPKSFGQIFFPGITALQQAGAESQAAPAAALASDPAASGAVRVPTIVAGAVPIHTERGTCTSCHNVVSPRGAAMPSIQLNSRPPHDNRGLCTNCHFLATSVQSVPAQAAPVALVAAAPAVDTSGAARVPTILAGAVPPHAERGTCTSCHSVVSPRGAAMPSIQLNSRPPHDNRGLCTNCHQLGGASAPTATGQTAATPAGLTLIAGTAPLASPAPMPASEGGWNGVEVTPITPLTASQYGVPQGAGLIVAEAEAAAAVAGIKAGDVMLAVNGSPTTTLTDFFRATGNGTIPRGAVELLRKGQRIQAVVDASVTAAPAAPVAAAKPFPFAAATPVAAAQPAAAAPAPPEGEWLGLEVAPISSITATQYGLPPGLPGLLVVEAEAQAATIGAKAGDVLQFVNGVPTTDMTRFFMATKNGTVTSGTIVLWRKGEQMVTRLGQAVAAAAAPAAPVANSIPAAQMTPYGQAPPNWAAYPQPTWPGANGMGNPPCAAAATLQGATPVAGGCPLGSAPGAGYATGQGLGQGFKQF